MQPHFTFTPRKAPKALAKYIMSSTRASAREEGAGTVQRAVTENQGPHHVSTVLFSTEVTAQRNGKMQSVVKNKELIKVSASLVAQTVKNLLQYRRPRFGPWVGKISQRREWQPTPVFLPEKSHRERSLVGCRAGYSLV